MSRRWFSRFRGSEPESEQVAPLAPPSAAPTSHHLVLVAGSTGEISPFFPLQAERTTIGRNPECDVQLLDATVSRIHAEIVRWGASYVLVHRSSVNPTRLNGMDLEQSQFLSNGDLIQLAKTVTLQLILHEAVAPAPQPAPGVHAEPESAAVPPARAAPPELQPPPLPEPKPALELDAEPPAFAQPPPIEAGPEGESERAPSDPVLEEQAEFRPVAAKEPAEPADEPRSEPAPEPVGAEEPPPPQAAPVESSPRKEVTPPPASRGRASASSASRPVIEPQNVELVIVGGGPAGLGAAVQAAMRGVKHTVLERSNLANTIVKYQKGKWVMDEPTRLPLQSDLELKFVAGAREEVLANWQADVTRSGANMKIGAQYEVQKIEGEMGAFHLHLKNGEVLDATHVVLAIGLQGNLRAFGVEGDGQDFVTYQLDDPSAYQGKNVVVVGVGDAGLENALALMEYDNAVSLVNRRAEMARAKVRNRTLAETAINQGDLSYYTRAAVDHFESDAVVLKTDEGEVRIEADLVIGRLGAIPPRRFLEDIGVEIASEDQSAVPDVSGTYESNVPGLHIIGALAGYPLIKNCMNQGFEVVEHILGQAVKPADQPVLAEKFHGVEGDLESILDRIRDEIPLYAGLTTVQLREYLFDSEIRYLQPGETIYARNEFSSSIFAVLEGQVQGVLPVSDTDTDVSLTSIVKVQQELVYGPGDFFGETSLLSGRRRRETVTTLTRCTLIESPRLSMNKLLRTVGDVRRVMDSTFIRRMLEQMAPGLGEEELVELAGAAEICSFASGDRLWDEGDEPDGLHLIRRGSIAISHQQEGRDHVVQYQQAGSYLGELALLGPGRKRSKAATARGITETILLPTAQIVPFLAQRDDVRRVFERRETDYAMAEAARAGSPQSRGTVMFMVKETGAHEATDLLLIDESLCIRCNNCEEACAGTHGGVSRLDREAGPTYQTSRGAQLHVPTACQHCENPHCMDDCPPDAIRRHPSGEVYIMDNCIGCGNCQVNCPYDVIQMTAVSDDTQGSVLKQIFFGQKKARVGDDEGEHAEHAVKCDLCVNLDKRSFGETRAACSASCPTGALVRVNPREFVDEILRS